MQEPLVSPHPVLVRMDVSRFPTFPKENLVQLWGHVGDYEVCLYLPMDDGRIQALLHPPKLPKPRKRKSTPAAQRTTDN